MPLSVKSYMGKTGFFLRKHFPALTSAAFLALQRAVQLPQLRRLTACYESLRESLPICVSIETVNRCNGHCAFCPASSSVDKRPLTVMSMDIYNKIVDELCAAEYENNVLMFNNNEPFLDPHFVQRLEIIKSKLPKAQIAVFTNGTLLTEKLLDEIAGKADKLVVGNYSEDYALTESSARIVEHVKTHPDRFKNTDVTVEYRYINEKLTNRAGSSPNKPGGRRVYGFACAMPFTDIVVYASGNVGLCCCDAQEKISFGNVADKGLLEIFRGERLEELRRTMASGGRSSLYPCRSCDFIGKSNMRHHAIKGVLSGGDVHFKL